MYKMPVSGRVSRHTLGCQVRFQGGLCLPRPPPGRAPGLCSFLCTDTLNLCHHLKALMPLAHKHRYSTKGMCVPGCGDVVHTNTQSHEQTQALIFLLRLCHPAAPTAV